MAAVLDWISHNAGVVGLIHFFIFFIVMAIWVYRPSAKESYKQKSNIPFMED